VSTSHPVYSFVLRTPQDAAELIATLKATAGPAAQAGRPLLVTVAQRGESRSAKANKYMWSALLKPAAAQLSINGQRFSAEALHEYFKRQHLPEVTKHGKQKWDVMPSGERRLAIGTGDLDGEEFGIYLEKCQAEAATEWGITFDAPQQIGHQQREEIEA
jgi:hypothetical protein